MRCLLCESFSLSHICSSCQTLYLTPKIYKRKIDNSIDVISFYRYVEIKELLHTKHTDLGYYIYSILAKNSFKKFAQNFQYNQTISSIGIDDNIKSGYSHTAILNRSLKSSFIEPKFNRLRADNPVSYSGQNREFRVSNPRKFRFHGSTKESIVLVDDIITTGSTLSQAIRTLNKEQKEVLFCLTLADASLK
ncbi:MAG: phosphoribosyltransferase family protein [Campylobacterota bacterium]|nr:phosphoribosyltransferase family protein [Campylobacterota bacterium]